MLAEGFESQRSLRNASFQQITWLQNFWQPSSGKEGIVNSSQVYWTPDALLTLEQWESIPMDWFPLEHTWGNARLVLTLRFNSAEVNKLIKRMWIVILVTYLTSAVWHNIALHTMKWFFSSLFFFSTPHSVLKEFHF